MADLRAAFVAARPVVAGQLGAFGKGGPVQLRTGQNVVLVWTVSTSIDLVALSYSNKKLPGR